jgi:hypothetical protein
MSNNLKRGISGHGNLPYHSHDEDFFAVFADGPGMLLDDLNHFELLQRRAFSLPQGLRTWAKLLLEKYDLFKQLRWLVGPNIGGVWWLGPRGAKTALHYDDDPCPVLFQVQGTKRLRLYSPDQSRFLYPMTTCPEGEYGTRFAVGDPERIRATKMEHRYPLALNATALEVTLHRGEALFIPVGWWHSVEVLSDYAISIAGKGEGLCEAASFFALENGIHRILNAGSSSSSCILPPHIDVLKDNTTPHILAEEVEATMQQTDTDQDGKLSWDEIRKEMKGEEVSWDEMEEALEGDPKVKEIFEANDRNGDSFIDMEELPKLLAEAAHEGLLD